MVESHLSSLKVLWERIEFNCRAPVSDGRSGALSDAWLQVVRDEMSEVFRGLERRGLVEWSDVRSGQTPDGPVQAEAEDTPMDPVEIAPPPGPDELAAAIASLEPEPAMAAAEPVFARTGPMNPPRPPWGAWDEEEGQDVA